MALEIGGAQKIFDYNQGVYNAIQDSPDFATYLGGLRDPIFDWSVSESIHRGMPTAAEALGRSNDLSVFLGQSKLPATRQNAQKQEAAARSAFESMSDADLAAIVGGASLVNLPEFNLGGNSYTLSAGVPTSLLPPSLSDDAGGVYSDYAKANTPGYNVGEASFEDIYNLLKGTDAGTFGASQDATFEHNLSREANPFGFSQILGGLVASGMLAAAGGAFGGQGLFGAPTTGVNAAANAVPGLSTGVTTPLGGGAIVGTGQAAPLLGIAGGAPLGASPLAIAGGATALPGVQGLPTGGQIPGTNQIIGTPDGGPAFNVDPKDVLRTVNTLNNIVNPPEQSVASGGMALPGPGYRGPTLYDGNPYPGPVTKLPAYFSYLRS